MNPDSLQKLKQKLIAIDEAVTLEELKKAIEAMLQFSVNLQNKTDTQLASIVKAVDTAIARIDAIANTEAQEAADSAKYDLMKQIDATMSSMMAEHQSMMAECDAKMASMVDGEDGQDGQDADSEEIVKEVLTKIPPPTTKEEIISAVQDMLDQMGFATLEGVDALKIEIDKKLLDNTRGSARGVFLKVNGAKKGFINEFNVVGSGVAYTEVNGLPTVTITGGSGVTAVETPTGIVNGSNDTFTVTNTPLYIIVDGVSKFPTLHYTFLAGTITVTDGAPPVQYIRSIYSA